MPAPKPYNKSVLGNTPPNVLLQQPVLLQTPLQRTPTPQVPQQLAQQPVRHVSRGLDGSDWLMAIICGGVAGVLAVILAGIMDNSLNTSVGFWLWVIISVCILPAIAGFITTKKAELKRAGVLAGFITLMPIGIVVILGNASSSDIGSVFLGILLVALFAMLPAFIGAWLATL